MKTLSTEIAPFHPNSPSTETKCVLQVALGDCPGGPLDHDGVELDDPEKGHCFDEMWGIKGRDDV